MQNAPVDIHIVYEDGTEYGAEYGAEYTDVINGTSQDVD